MDGGLNITIILQSLSIPGTSMPSTSGGSEMKTPEAATSKEPTPPVEPEPAQQEGRYPKPDAEEKQRYDTYHGFLFYSWLCNNLWTYSLNTSNIHTYFFYV